MKAQVLRGTKEQIAETVIRIPGEVREAVVFVDEPLDSKQDVSRGDLFAEMEAFTVQVSDADYSRETVYTQMDGE